MVKQLNGSRGGRNGSFSKWRDGQTMWEKGPKGYGGTFLLPAAT
jgi:hypothetical protein